MAEVGVRGGDADGLARFQGRAEDRGKDMTANSTGVHLLELEVWLILLWRGGNGHRNYSWSLYH